MAEDRPLLVVVGNCQAESFRLLLDAGDVRTVRTPALHELTAADAAALRELLARTDLLVAQPTSDDYRGLPVGTRQLRAVLPPGARVALVPSLRYSGLHPFHLLVHPPGLERPDPPVVPYHDLRTALLADDLRAGRPVRPPLELTEDVVRAVAAASVAELARRERQHGTVVVSDLFAEPDADAMRTINHPGNAVLVPVAARLRDALGLEPRGPGVDRPLLASIHAPVLPPVVAAHRLDVVPTSDWTIEGRTVTTEAVTAAHLAWYRERPEMLDAALERAAPLVELFGPGGANPGGSSGDGALSPTSRRGDPRG
ncbi:peptide ABC transporter ATPase [Nocardioides dongxiaopingii]|uniref:WcbI family polysaccharide biosynthesis putative acetyltransferase n=1 Tax=Nocardioides sp. S-1144 TaxID=2582905 RepID=UPI00110DC242|nr:WcbI family polysaccharide biosynthesis putative acetyltransferase [Nocardioides sp. S-1144]QCW51582.1 peptide ABC transporter ATPase [Nocardioides sp. S-1144]